MNTELKPNLQRRMRSIAGHVTAVERMLDEDAYCIDTIKQIQAVQAALNKVSALLLENHLNSCVVTAVNGKDPKERARVLEEIASVFETATKV